MVGSAFYFFEKVFFWDTIVELLLKMYGVKSKFGPFLHLLCSNIVGFGQWRKELVPLKQTPKIVQNQTKSRVPGDIMFLVSRPYSNPYGSEKAII